MKNLWQDFDDFDANNNDNNFFCANLRNIDVSLLVHWRFVDDSLKKHWRYSEDFDANISDHKCFFYLISETLMFFCCFVDDLLMIHWRDIFEALIFLLATFLIFIVLVLLNTDWITNVSLLVHWLFVDDSLKNHRRYSEDFDASINYLQGFYWPNLRNFGVS